MLELLHMDSRNKAGFKKSGHIALCQSKHNF